MPAGTTASPRTHGIGDGELEPSGEGDAVGVGGIGSSVTARAKASEVALPVRAGPPVGTGQLARIHTEERSPSTTRSGSSVTLIGSRLSAGAGDSVEVSETGLGEFDGAVSASAVHPVTAATVMAPTIATCLTFDTARAPFRRTATIASQLIPGEARVTHPPRDLHF